MLEASYTYNVSRQPVRIEQFRSMPNYALALDVPTISACDIGDNQLARGLPLIITDGLDHWDGLSKWHSNAYLACRSGGSEIFVTPHLALDGLLMGLSEIDSDECHLLRMPMDKYLYLMTTGYDPDRIFYARNIAIPDGISRDVSSASFFPKEDWGRSLFVGRRTYTDCHEHHGCDAMMCQVRGVKEVILHPPDALHKQALYANPYTRNWSPVRFFDVDEEAFPLFSLNKPWKAVVNPGETLYIPDPWWHCVISADDELDITVTYWFPPHPNPQLQVR
jgi:hypothetical protein